MQVSVVRFLMATLVCAAVGCGAGSKDAAAPKAEANDAGAPDAAPEDAGPVDAGRPFAANAAEATQLITDAVDRHQAGLANCVQQYRFRTHLAHEKIAVQIGIDQEGRVMGVTLPKRKADVELSGCVQEQLRDAMFPRSKAGVITITRSFEEMVK